MGDATAMIETILEEGPIGTDEAAKLLGTFGGKATHPTTLVRWSRVGVKLSDGKAVRLEAVRIGGRLATSRAAIIRFIAAQQPATDPVTPIGRNPSKRRKSSETAAQALAAMGA